MSILRVGASGVLFGAFVGQSCPGLAFLAIVPLLLLKENEPGAMKTLKD